jgi:hypothetical protein
MKTQVAIIGAGPAGLMLGHLLRSEGIDCVVVERVSGDYVLSRIRAGVLERVTTDIMERLGLAERMHAEGLPHDGFNLADGERLIRIDIAGLTGKQVMVYGQTEITKDLMDAAPDRGLEVIYDADDVSLHDIESDMSAKRGSVRYVKSNSRLRGWKPITSPRGMKAATRSQGIARCSALKTIAGRAGASSRFPNKHLHTGYPQKCESASPKAGLAGARAAHFPPRM